jgi:hypothetical protein
MSATDSNDGKKRGTQAVGAGNKKRKRLLKTREAAEYLRLSPRTLEDMRYKGGGPAWYRLGSGRRGLVVYDIDELDSWLEPRRQE